MRIVIEIDNELYQTCRDFLGDADPIKSAIANGIPFQEISDRENSEIKNEVKDLFKRVETLEKQIREDKEEQIKKLKAEIDFAKFRCSLSPWML